MLAFALPAPANAALAPWHVPIVRSASCPLVESRIISSDHVSSSHITTLYHPFSCSCPLRRLPTSSLNRPLSLSPGDCGSYSSAIMSSSRSSNVAGRPSACTPASLPFFSFFSMSMYSLLISWRWSLLPMARRRAWSSARW
jgi:hypothetical protein